VHHGNRFHHLNSRKVDLDVRSRAVAVNPLEHVFYRAAIFDALAISGDGRPIMESRTHQTAVARPGTGDIAMHGPRDGVMLDEVGIAEGYGGKDLNWIRIRILCPRPALGLKLMAVGEDRVLLCMPMTAHRQALAGLPAPHGALAMV